MLGLRVELGTVGMRQARFMACKLNHRKLHAQADPQIRHVMFACVLNGQNLAFGTTFTKTTWHQNRIKRFEHVGSVLLKRFRINVINHHARFGMDTCVNQRFAKRLVRLSEIDIFAYHRDAHLMLGVLKAKHQLIPDRQVCLRGINRQHLANEVVESLLMQHAWDFID